ncbi:extracellular solute-binding protein [Paenibacillus sp. GYB004]|uniref:ABC transporter substrate-binding protein n=1 Tax=Paenibacillus sp. GYB004 TaxID=2994393 RepID=UPI002F96C03F
MKKRTSIWAAVCILMLLVAACSKAEPSGTAAEKGEGGVEIVTIEVMTRDASAPTRVTNFVEAAESLNKKLEEEGSKQRVKVEQIVKSMGEEEFDQHFIFASKSGNTADIYATGYSKVGWMADGDYLLPLEGIDQQKVFENLMPGYWDAVKWDNRIWGVIQDTEARPIFFNKNVLKKLGWTDDQIKSLPQKAENGEFTLAEMAELAQKAVDQKATGGGLLLTAGGKDLPIIFLNHGTEVYDAQAGKYVLDKAGLTDTFTFLSKAVNNGTMERSFLSTGKDDMLKAMINDDVLFLQAGIWDEAKWRTRGMHNKLGNVTSEYVMDNIGVMVMPTAKKGMKPVTVSNPWVYVVPKKTKHPELVTRLLVEVSSPKLQAEHGVQTSHIPFTKEGQEYDTVKQNAWLNYVGYLTSYSRFMPNHPDQPKFEKILKDATQNIVNGDMSPEQAVSWMEKQMKLNLGDAFK